MSIQAPSSPSLDPKDALHEHCRTVLKTLKEALLTTIPVLTEAFHLLTPGSQGADRLRDFIVKGGVDIWFMDNGAIDRAFELMERYADHPMDLADASLIVVGERTKSNKVFTIDRRDFETYRIRLGHRQTKVEIIS